MSDKEKVVCIMATKISVLDVLYYSMVIGAGFISGIAFVATIAFQIAKLIF